MSWLRSVTAGSPLVGFVLALVLGLSSGRAMAAGDVCELQLEVFINQAPTHLIGSFTMATGRKIAAAGGARGDRVEAARLCIPG